VVAGEGAQEESRELPAERALKSIAGRKPRVVEPLERGEVLEQTRRCTR
jgi:hypothetical protein